MESTPRGPPSAGKVWLKAIELIARIEAEPRRLFADVVEGRARRHPQRPAFLSSGKSLSYGGRAARINQ